MIFILTGVSFLRPIEFCNSNQHDAHEFVNGWLDVLHVERAAAASGSSTFSSVSSCISQFYLGLFQSTVQCRNVHCQYSSINTEAFTSISLPLCEGSFCTLSECFNLLCAEETLGETEQAMCANCQRRTNAKKTLKVRAWPELLVVHLKRFKGVPCRFGTNIVTHHRLDTPISFPISNFCVDAAPSQKVAYDCVGVVNHMGTCANGHYTAHALRDSDWFFFDDGLPPRKIETPEGSLNHFNQNAYMLFYVRQGNDAARAVVK
jgi:ubiquitin C-terminal hydrolase